jgi:hypothetical protein
MEKLMETMLKDPAVPKKYSVQYEAERRRYAKDQDDVNHGRYKGGA